MTAIFPTFFRDLLYASLDKVAPLDPNTNLMAGKSVHWVYFRSHAAFTDTNDARYMAIKSVSDLAGRTGWSAPSTPQSATAVVGTTAAGSSTYCIANNKFNMGGGWTTSTVSAAALVLEGTHNGTVDPIIYITDTPFQGMAVMRPTDGLIARPVSALAGNRSLFSWPNWATGMTSVQPIEGSVAVTMGAPDFEAAYTHHAWLYPQRVNFIANPSFDTLTGTNHWRTNGILTKQPGTKLAPVAPGGSAQNLHYGRVTGTAPLALESNLFPLYHRGAYRDSWTIQAMVRGTGKLRVGLVGWGPTFVAATADWGDMGDYTEEWDLSPGSYTHVYALRRSYENTMGLARFECSGGTMEIDNVLCESDWLRGWRYFDGDSTFGARDDHSWYGGENRHGATFSCYYNHRRAVIGRLFAWDIEADDFTITDEEVEAQGFVYKWVPAGVRVAAHLDVLWPDDIQEPVPDVTGTAVTPYNIAQGWLTPTVGTATTPDPGVVPAQSVWVMKVRGPTVVSTIYQHGIVSQYELAGNLSFSIRRHESTRRLSFHASTNGTNSNTSTIFSDPTPVGTDEWLALARDWSNGSQNLIAYRSTDGVTWTNIGTANVELADIFNSTSVVRIGASGAVDIWDGRIYWVEHRTGLDPAAGSLLWRFDANDYPGTGTVWTDPRGQVWTLTNASAITPKIITGVDNPWV